ncbi:MAG: hypothetical protein EPN79_11710 [Burkholderiaceae bacterium]|nr:MAG: hypothetical protein EPN79_11710 [Burkholderiaceae bacterium]TBR76677.1 MAG: hypothetical protein EPN64_05355 [Burkholderiaceae bacterium]
MTDFAKSVGLDSHALDEWTCLNAQLARIMEKHDVRISSHPTFSMRELYLEWISVNDVASCGAGAGTLAMQEVVAAADEAGWSITLRVRPCEEEGRLLNWYREFGFISAEGDELLMRRHPGAPVTRRARQMPSDTGESPQLNTERHGV